MRSPLSTLLAVGPELATYILTAPLLDARGAYTASAQNIASSSNLDLSELGRVAIGGDFDSISLYQYLGQNENLSNNGSQSLLTRYPDGSFRSLALADADATIAAMCPFVTTDGTLQGVVVGGNFTSLGGVQAASVALWNPTSNEVVALPGLSGPVNALYCDATSGTVYVGGNFMAGNSTNAMAWTTGWVNLPFAGFNGPVQTIEKNSAGNIVFGGQFDGLGNTTSPNGSKQADSQAINLGSGSITAAGSSSTAGFSDPANIICQRGSDEAGNTWLLNDNTGGYWDVQSGFGFIPTNFSLYNTARDGRGTKTFYFEEMNSGGVLNLTYTNSVSGETEWCVERCPLPENNSTAQDFAFVRPIGMNHFRIWITEWYGAGAGLSGIEMFSDDMFDYAVNSFNEPKCSITTGQGTSSTATPADRWVRTPNQGLTESDFLTATLTEPSQVSDDTRVVFQPVLRESGNYSVTVYTPGCVLDGSCATRGRVNMTGTMTSSDTISQVLFQTNNYDKFDQIYYGYIDADSSPMVTLTPVAGQQVPLTVVANRVRFELVTSTAGSTGELNGLYEYNPREVTSDSANFSSSAVNTAGSSLQSRATINKVVQGSDALFVGGSFSSDGFHNIMAINDEATTLVKGGLDGAVLDMYMEDRDLYIGGTFNNTKDSPTEGLNHIALFSTANNEWSALGGGVNGAVYSIVPLQLNVTTGNLQNVITLTGNFTSVNSFGGNAAFEATGFTVWVPSEKNWLHNVQFANVALGGELTAYSTVPGMAPVYGGVITSQGLEYSNVVELVGGNEPKLEALDVQLLRASRSDPSTTSSKHKRALIGENAGQNYTGVYDGLFYSQNNLNITVLGGSFSASTGNGQSVENLVFINNTDSTASTSGISGLSSDSIFVAMDTYETQLWAGGAINGTAGGNEVTGLIVYDLVANDFVSPHPPALHGDNVVVNAVSAQPSSTNVYVGGHFSSAGSLQCAALCTYDTKQLAWQSLGTGLRGTVNDMMWASKTQLIIAGNLTIFGNATTMATYDTKKQIFEAYTGASTLPGPIVALTAVSNSYDEFWAAGVSTSDNSAFLYKFADNTWTPATGLGPDSSIRKLQIMPLSTPHANSELMSSNQVLLILGAVELPSLGNASAVLFNGTAYEPFILTSMQGGGQGSLSALFVSRPQNLMSGGGHHLALGLVVVIGLAIALGIVFLMVVAGILMERRRRKKEGYVPMTVDKGANLERVPPEKLFGQGAMGKDGAPRI
ncbi:unnamed protein product [Zymoseptoria tritici ST99CH_1A5]|uniref:Uncharacterized protein n=1 Tax=Zymoseptoria tritici ST99CH_1A5 TaxID=1276529 RepID=A0A1Y6LK20_ZYMTR|nr:unnamed protein product [Zymoseptoria tritici ST99CH_1A5]